MNQNGYLKNFHDALVELDKALYWLKRSYNICKKIGVKEEYDEDEFDAFEALTGRFARLSDMLLQKVFRSIDKLELEKEGTLLDVVNRAQKKGLIDSVDEIREFRELRNAIANGFTPGELQELFEDTLKYTEILFEIVNRVKKYASKFKA